uniref:Uncharacterized protein n=1 Tax=Gracilinema caldarium TaxID=215591 RepID=A0A7C3EC37_9SPIR
MLAKNSAREARALFLGPRPWVGKKRTLHFLAWRWNFSEWVINIADPEQGPPNRAHIKKGSARKNDPGDRDTELVIHVNKGEQAEETARKLEAFMRTLRQGRGEEVVKAYIELQAILSSEAAQRTWQFLRQGGLAVGNF